MDQIQLLNPFPQCEDCLMSLARSSVVLSQPQNSHLLSEAEKRAGVEESKGKGLTSPAIANKILKEVTRLLGVPDPYADFKAREVEIARAMFAKIESQIGSSLRSRIVLSALGNSLDFFESPRTLSRRSLGTCSVVWTFISMISIGLTLFFSKRPDLILFFPIIPERSTSTSPCSII